MKRNTASRYGAGRSSLRSVMPPASTNDSNSSSEVHERPKGRAKVITPRSMVPMPSEIVKVGTISRHSGLAVARSAGQQALELVDVGP